MKLATWNVNGLRAAAGKGFSDWFERSELDAVCLQEVKARSEQLPEALAKPKGFFSSFHAAEKAGYSGVAILAKREPERIWTGIGDPEADAEGRVLGFDYPDYTLISAYFPNSQRDHARLPFKLRFCERLAEKLEALRASGRHVLICGDFNIAHREIDLKNPKTNGKNAGFLPQERAWMDRFVGLGWVDVFRRFEPGPEQYTWWSYRPGVREKNIGWRLDYFFANPEWADRLKAAAHEPAVRGSDHCPVRIELKD